MFEKLIIFHHLIIYVVRKLETLFLFASNRLALSELHSSSDLSDYLISLGHVSGESRVPGHVSSPGNKQTPTL